jgi:hypothetical protein
VKTEKLTRILVQAKQTSGAISISLVSIAEIPHFTKENRNGGSTNHQMKLVGMPVSLETAKTDTT